MLSSGVVRVCHMTVPGSGLRSWQIMTIFSPLEVSCFCCCLERRLCSRMERSNIASWSGLTMLSRHSCETLSGKQAHTQLLKEHSATVVSAHWATVDWSWPKKWNWLAQVDLKTKKQKKSTGRECIVEPSPTVLASEEKNYYHWHNTVGIFFGGGGGGC